MAPILRQSNDPNNDPMMIISPHAKMNFVDHTLTDQNSIVRFIEHNWSLGRLGGYSSDAIAGPMLNALVSAPRMLRR